MANRALPASGAWTPADPPGARQFFTFASDHPFAVESGQVLSDVTVAYETWGTLNADASNAILVCHAWTGDSHAAGRAGPPAGVPLGLTYPLADRLLGQPQLLCDRSDRLPLRPVLMLVLQHHPHRTLA